MRFYLNLTFILDRIAVERVAAVYGTEYFDNAHAVNLELLKRWIKPDASVLDIGCARGHWAREVAKIARAVVGIDHDEKLIRLAEMNKPDNVRFIVGDVREINQTFDVAVLFHILEHIENPVQFLQNLKSAANSIVIEVPNHEFDFLNVARRREGLPFYTDADHVREYTKDLLREHLEAAGWHIVELINVKGSLVCFAKI